MLATSQIPTPARRQAAPGRCMAWRRPFPGEARQVGLMRRWLMDVLPGCPSRETVVSCASELASNAIRHTRTGEGGWFTVEVTWQPDLVRVAVADDGAVTRPRVITDPRGEHGRGLLLVHGLARQVGSSGGRQGRLVWADLAWDGPAAGSPAAGCAAGAEPSARHAIFSRYAR